VATLLEADYLVVGAGAMGMAFTDALTDHADVRVVLVDRRHAPGGHWLDAYPFVRLHQASAFYGVPSTLLGGGRTQTDGPEAGLHERATAPEICAYFARVLRDRMVPSGKVSFHPGCTYLGDRTFVSRVSGRRYEVGPATRVVDATYLAPTIPASTPAPFAVAAGARVIPVNDLVRLEEAPSQFVIVGSGKTATDACVWLLENGVDPGAICWVRPRDPWMINRAVVQPDPVVWQHMVADMLTAATGADSADEFFLRLEDAGIMVRIDRSVVPTMAKAPTLAQHELDRLRTIDDVVRLGHVRGVEPGRLLLDRGEVDLPNDAVVVHCAASGLQNPPLVPIWGEDAIRLQTSRVGVPCFNAALAGFVEATVDGDQDKNRLCPPTPYSNSVPSWARMQVLGSRAVASYMSHPDVAAWANSVVLNPARLPPETEWSADLSAEVARVRACAEAGMARLTEHAGLPTLPT
jgi:NAD(P)-binding Rossmann-like domain